MNIKMNQLIYFVILLSLSVSQYGATEPCPKSFSPLDDWDKDEILNVDDVCCFTATLHENNKGSFCPEGELVDLNMNGISSKNEGECCITPEGFCGILSSTRCKISNSDLVSVSCDQLLYYEGMTSPNKVAACDKDCICYSIEDFDKDYKKDQSISGAADNCPVTYNPVNELGIQSDKDSDLFGDACDLDENIWDEPISCNKSMKQDICSADSLCVPFVFYFESQTEIKLYCSVVSSLDRDTEIQDKQDASVDVEDTENDLPDSEIEKDTEKKKDTDAETDKEKEEERDCTDNESENVDRDSDGILDKEDNCPTVWNPEQNFCACGEDLYLGGALSCDCKNALKNKVIGAFDVLLILLQDLN